MTKKTAYILIGLALVLVFVLGVFGGARNANLGRVIYDRSDLVGDVHSGLASVKVISAGQLVGPINTTSISTSTGGFSFTGGVIISGYATSSGGHTYSGVGAFSGANSFTGSLTTASTHSASGLNTLSGTTTVSGQATLSGNVIITGDVTSEGGTIFGSSTSQTTYALQVVQNASSSLALGSATLTGCIVIGDTDGAGVSYLTALNGVLSATTTQPGICR